MDERLFEEEEVEESPRESDDVNDRLFGDNDSRDAWEWALEDDDDLTDLTLEG